MRTTRKTTVVGMAAAGLLAWAGGASAGGAGAASPPGQAQGAAADRSFIARALAVNELELRLGRLAGERARSAEVKAMGQQMTEKHGALGRELAALAQDAGGPVEPAPSAEQQATYARLASLPPDAFDAAFREAVDAGHVDELAMYRDEAARAASPALRSLVVQRVGVLEQSVAKAEAEKGATRAAAAGTAAGGKDW